MTNFEHEHIQELEDLIRYADHHRDFDRKFLDGVYDFFYENGNITEDQAAIIYDLHEKHNVNGFVSTLLQFREESGNDYDEYD